MAFSRVTIHWGKENNQNLQVLLDTGSELTRVSRDPKCHCGPAVTVGAYECQVINGVLAEVHITVGPLGPRTHVSLFFPVLECIIGINMFSSWQNSHVGSLIWEIKANMVGQAKWKPLEMPLPRKIVNKKQHYILEKLQGFKDLVVIPSTSPFNSPIRPVLKRDGSSWKWQWVLVSSTRWWRQLHLLYQMWFHCFSKLTHLLVPGTQLLIWQCLFLHLSQGPAEEVWCQGYTNSPALCHNLVHRDLNRLSLPQAMTWAYYSNDIMQEVAAITLNILWRYLCDRVWEINTTKTQRPSTLVKFPGVRGMGHVKISLPRGRISCCIWPLLQSRSRHNAWWPVFILEATYSLFQCATVAHLPNHWKSC